MTASVGILMLGLKSSQTERAIKGIVGFRASPHCGQPELAFAYPSKFCWQFFKLEAMTWGKGALHFCSRVTSVAQDGGRQQGTGKCFNVVVHKYATEAAYSHAVSLRSTLVTSLGATTRSRY